MRSHRNALRVGARRGWHEQVLSLRSSQDQAFYLFLAFGTLAFLYFNRDNMIDELGLSLAQVAMPSIIAGVLVFGLVVGPSQSIAMEREDGTVLRLASAPGGTLAYATGQIVLHVTSLVPTLVLLLVPAALFFDAGSQRGAAGWGVAVIVITLGALATLPIGIIVGCLVPDARRATTWGILPIVIAMFISGIFIPVSQLWGWLQPIALISPLYWFGHGMRFAFLPDAAKAAEWGGEWNMVACVLALLAWAIIGWVGAVLALRRAGRRQSGSAVAGARERAAQWVR
jgi:ABC-2 type transport system permease protein